MASLFVSGPFTGSCQIARMLVRAAAEAQGIKILEKSGHLNKPAAELMEEADGVVLVYGGTEPAIEDVWGMSLVELEMRYASVRKKPVLGVLLAPTGPLGPTMKRLRGHLERQLTEAIYYLSEVPESIHLGLSQLAVYHAITLRYGIPLPKEMRENLAPDLRDPQVAAGLIAKLPAGEGVVVPMVSTLVSILERLEKYLRDWQNIALPVFSDRVFISYARSEVTWASDLEERLTEAGLSPWRDQKQMRTGEQFLQIIRNEIENSGAFIAIISERSASSPWVLKEVDYALAAEERYGANTFFILPIRVGNTPHDAIKGLEDRDQITLDPGEDLTPVVDKLVRDLARRRQRAIDRLKT